VVLTGATHSLTGLLTHLLTYSLTHTDVSNFTEDDFKSALHKLTIAATKYIPVEAVSPLTAFETAVMPPHVFKEQLKLAFNIKLSMKELSALISYFDKEGKGIINCKDFLMIFYRTGYDERNRIRSIWRKEIVEKDQQRKIEEEERLLTHLLTHLLTYSLTYSLTHSLTHSFRLRQNLARNALDVDFDFSESDFDSALMKIVNMCRLFDKRQLGPAGFAAFTSESLSPVTHSLTHLCLLIYIVSPRLSSRRWVSARSTSR